MSENFEGDKITLERHLLCPEIFSPALMNRFLVNRLPKVSLNVRPILKLVYRAEKNIPILLVDKIRHFILEAWREVDLETLIDLHARSFFVSFHELILVFV